MSSTKRLQLFHGFVFYILQHGYSWINLRRMYEMLRYPVPEALTFMIYQETHTATMTCGSKCYILLLRTVLCFDDCRAWTVLV